MTPSNEFKPKTFWERPEGTTGMVAIGLGVLGLALLAPAILAFFNTMVALFSAGIVMIGLGVVLFALIMIVTNKKVHALVGYMFKSAMRKVTGAFVEIDPIGIMKSYIEDLRKKRDTMRESIDKLRGQVNICKKQIQDNNTEHDNQMSLASVAKNKGSSSAATVAARQAGRLAKLNKESLAPMLLQMEVHLRALNKYYEVTGTVIEDLGNEVKAQKMQRDMITASHSAMATAKRILQGGGDQKEIFDQAMEYVVNDYGMKMGEIENFIENSKGFVESLDLQNGVYEEDALKRLQEWEEHAESILLGNGKQRMLEQQHQNSPLNTSIGAPAAQDYSRWLK